MTTINNEPSPSANPWVQDQVESDRARTLSRVETRIAAKQRRREDKISRAETNRKLKEQKRDWRSDDWKNWAESGAAAALWVARSIMTVGPIAIPMAVAWTGQSSFAMGVLMWTFAASLVYAAAYELTTVFCAWMAHQARSDGDKGWEYRIATWLFALGAAVQQWWHHSDNWDPTPRAVTYSSMTLIGLGVWELHGRLTHRRKLRLDGKLDDPRPRFGPVRWLRYPHITWTAWSLSVLHNLTTIEQAWSAAEKEIKKRKDRKVLEKEGKNKGKRIRKQIETDPAEVIVERADRKADRKALPPGSARTSSDPPRTKPDPARISAGSESHKGPDLAGSPPDRDDGDFSPTDLERQAIQEMADKGIRINRSNVADYIRNELKGPIATKRAAEVAKWGRDNGDASTLKAVS